MNKYQILEKKGVYKTLTHKPDPAYISGDPPRPHSRACGIYVGCRCGETISYYIPRYIVQEYIQKTALGLT